MINPLQSNSQCYPVEIQCQDGDDYGGIIIQEFNTEENKESVNYLTAEQSEDFSPGTTNNKLGKQDDLELIPSIVMSQNDSLQFASDGVHQEVELLITDQTTGDFFYHSL